MGVMALRSAAQAGLCVIDSPGAGRAARGEAHLGVRTRPVAGKEDARRERDSEGAAEGEEQAQWSV